MGGEWRNEEREKGRKGGERLIEREENIKTRNVK
jgi:hypothetical protein